MASTYLTLTTTAGSMVKWTWSAWVKKSGIATEQNIFTGYNAATDYTEVRFDTSDRLNFQNKVAGSFAGELQTRRVFRDSGWYHIVIVWDTGNATGDDRIRMYINGVRETDFIGTDIPTLNKASNIGEASVPTHIGSFATGSNFFDGLMSDICFIDGQALAPTSFGETDTDTGEWKISDIASDAFTWGTNGYMILNNGDTITDQSTNSNDFTLGAGTLTNSKDCPSNVFSTWNTESTVIYKQGGNQTYANGNTSIIESGGVYKSPPTTVGAFTGKYYCELKFIGTVGSSLLYSTMGGVITANDVANLGDNYNHAGETAQSVGYGAYDGKTYISNVGTAYGDTLADGDILSVALDLDNSKVYFSKNGVWQNSGDPTSGATGTGAVSLPASTSSWHFIGSPTNSTISANFGNGYFGTTAVADNSTTPASTPGTFNYDVPAGYQPLSTKGINA